MLTPTGRTLRTGGVVFTLAGLLFGNWPVFGAGALLLMLVASSTLGKPPVVKRRLTASKVERGGRVGIVLDVQIPRGLGVVEIHQPLPEEFELVEGNNFHVVTMGMRARRESYHLEIRAPKRGEWTIAPVGVKLLHAAGLAEVDATSSATPLTLVVEPRPLPARIPRDLRARAKRPLPEGDLARMGIATNDFRELREYVPGDPPRRINWKATARRVGSGASEVPLVNETEWEGKKCVWIVVDGAAKLSVGTNVEDAREHAADAALSLVEIYLRHGYQVGITTARSGDLPILRPGTGESQILKARELLARLRAGTKPALLDVLARDAALLHRKRPLVVLVTRVAGEDPDLRAALRRLGSMGHQNGRNLVPGLLLDVEPASAQEEGLANAVARRALENGRLSTQAAAHAANVRVVTWRAGRDPLQAVLLRGKVM